MSATLAAAVVLAAVLGVALRRDLMRAEREQARRAWLRANPRAREIAAALDVMRTEIGAAMLPAMREFARAASVAVARISGER